MASLRLNFGERVIRRCDIYGANVLTLHCKRANGLLRNEIWGKVSRSYETWLVLDIYVDEKTKMASGLYQQASQALVYLQTKVPVRLHQPAVGIICGSGLSGLAESVLPEPRCEISYTDIPHFPPSTGREQNPQKDAL